MKKKNDKAKSVRSRDVVWCYAKGQAWLGMVTNVTSKSVGGGAMTFHVYLYSVQEALGYGDMDWARWVPFDRMEWYRKVGRVSQAGRVLIEDDVVNDLYHRAESSPEEFEQFLRESLDGIERCHM